MLFGKLSPVHIHSYLSSSSLLHRCCLAHVYPSPSSSSLSPFLYFSSSPPLHCFSLATPCLLHQILFVSPSALSPNVSSFLHPVFLPSLPRSPSTQTQMFKLSTSLVFLLHFFVPPHPVISPRCFLDRDDLSSSDNETEKCPEANEGGSCHSRSLDKAAHTVTQAVWVCVCMWWHRADVEESGSVCVYCLYPSFNVTLVFTVFLFFYWWFQDCWFVSEIFV